MNADMVGSEPYRGLVVRKGRRTLVEKVDLWPMPMARPTWGRVRFAPDMDTQH